MCELPYWLMIATVSAGMAPAAALGLWVFSALSKVGRKVWSGDFHRQRLYDCGGVLAGMAAFTAVTLVTAPLAFSFVC